MSNSINPYGWFCVAEEGKELQEALQDLSGQRTVPNVFIRGTHVGGCDSTMQAKTDGRLARLLSPPPSTYDYDLIVIGGGSGGLAASKVRNLILSR